LRGWPCFCPEDFLLASSLRGRTFSAGGYCPLPPSTTPPSHSVQHGPIWHENFDETSGVILEVPVFSAVLSSLASCHFRSNEPFPPFFIHEGQYGQEASILSFQKRPPSPAKGPISPQGSLLTNPSSPNTFPKASALIMPSSYGTPFPPTTTKVKLSTRSEKEFFVELDRASFPLGSGAFFFSECYSSEEQVKPHASYIFSRTYLQSPPKRVQKRRSLRLPKASRGRHSNP